MIEVLLTVFSIAVVIMLMFYFAVTSLFKEDE